MSQVQLTRNRPNMNVSELIEENRRQWRISFVESNFSERDASCILAIHLFGEDQVDEMSWKFTQNGITTISWNT